MQPGTIVKTVYPPEQVDMGALALVVDGDKFFPKLYAELLSRVGEFAGEFIWVKWVKKSSSWHGQPDGAYAKHRFIEAQCKRIINTRGRILN